MKVGWAQHDVYYDALKIIVENCNRLAFFALRVLRSDNLENWGTIYRFDHRTLQFQHDLLATVWRYKTQASQIRLDCDEDANGIQRRWLDWLTNEVQCWTEKPDWVRLVQIILANQNTPLGQRTETLLTLQIMDYFADVPWDESLKRALEREIKED